MISALVRTARDRLTIRHVLGYVAAVAIVYGISQNASLVLGIATAFVITEAMAVVREAPGIDGRWAGVGIGLFITGISLVWFAYEYVVPASDGLLWFPALTAGVGVWFLLDARRDFVEDRRRDGTQPADDMTSSEAMLVMSHAHLVSTELESGPKTVPELAAACDLTESRVREVIDVVGDDGTIYPLEESAADDATRYALDESKVGAGAFVRSIVGPAARRLVRPFRG
ncbi:hypothetical protein Halru_1637 [Halovivax ruber XH-70]|uniref:Uncharacterized protein n=1 Tax=Halovivax ruber (strain DSM 18193 / JCM 13892 / XH-70) TaxID=797302 RepID=L0IBV3_HALRX|nr:hypothetical protein [Halovivax ruber]AGB16244.1 hypothetical protein Halru_1637 [Halovivax ruber XH-70]